MLFDVDPAPKIVCQSLRFHDFMLCFFLQLEDGRVKEPEEQEFVLVLLTTLAGMPP